MHLVEILERRTRPAAGVLMALTRRCPLSCSHCSTNSMISSEEYPDQPFRNLVDSFTPQCRPDLVYLSGGEALLRAELVRYLAAGTRRAGGRTVLLSGMYFARDGRQIPRAVREAIASVDHFTASLDEFHEREVSRAEVFAAMHRIRRWVPAVSFQLTGLDDEDPYLAGLVRDVRAEFADEVPILVDHVNPRGRAQRFVSEQEEVLIPGAVIPCGLAAWPLVHYEGTVFACCAQDVVARHRPEHLVLGHAETDPWPVIRERALHSPMLRAIRLAGPLHVESLFAAAPSGSPSYCGTCVALAGDPGIAPAVERYLDTEAGAGLELVGGLMTQRAGADGFARRLGAPRYSELVTLGREAP
ncbi:radical SAM protein [Micromonospora sp. Llam7]|uniref:radical SAM protein n=1 Tax=Micromonospora tarapacensis TaxID=2835305 RepID=UPI001C82A4DE|nr:radical SAM protein [Micromonospora tarapacensis]MBX7265710.1 radical SAM protein [Micromonospora tarapacensis]